MHSKSKCCFQIGDNGQNMKHSWESQPLQGLVPAFTCWWQQRRTHDRKPPPARHPAHTSTAPHPQETGPSISHAVVFFTNTHFQVKQCGDGQRYQSSPFHFALSSPNCAGVATALVALAWRDSEGCSGSHPRSAQPDGGNAINSHATVLPASPEQSAGGSASGD